MKPSNRHRFAAVVAVVAIVSSIATSCDSESTPERPPPKPRAKVAIAIGHAPLERMELSEGVVLETIVPVVSAVELHTCPDDSAASVIEFLVPPAHAHVPTSATRLGDPAASDLLDGRPASRVIGEIAAPLERFCNAWIIFAPADDDVLNVTPIDDDDLIGKTLVARTETGDLHSSSAVRAVEVKLVDPDGGGPLRFDKSGGGAMLLFDLKMGELPTKTDEEERATPLGDQLLSAIDVSMRRFDVPSAPTEQTEQTEQTEPAPNDSPSSNEAP